ncbi:pitrilysin family protein [Synechococcus sp. PCC 6312]|uniref:M16 family metallopeptidase n=1 Tax=Synechococcus sp. (strain ATCC 27167 / PCC 6312) TaxID=195253 RepID=UPI00029F13D0|nr:pitrilysin family protein [Synechococcus sp. PCC 6312]AFY61267.1 putative Zn-dependent peptidase [Synechococcus sp. PCC 6312]
MSSTLTSVSLTVNVIKTELDNGLVVLIKEIPTAPVVSLQVWYRVGSAQEAPGQNGIAHQLEHLMFKGTQARPIQFGQLFSAIGSQTNAFTSYDMTAYFHTVRASQLEPLLILEADRMVNTDLSPSHLSSEKRVVISELQGYENSPEYRLSRTLMNYLYPDHPYGLPVGGTVADVESFSLEAVQSYYRQFYRPDNAVLVITGDIETQATLQLVTDIFAPISRPDFPLLPHKPRTPRPGLAPTTPIILSEPGSAPLLQILYPLPPCDHPDFAAIEVLDAILTAGRSSRLYQALVETGLVSSVSAYAAGLQAGGWYELDAVATLETSLEEVLAVLQAEICQIQTEFVSQEALDQAKTQLQAHFILRNRDIDSQAGQLAYDQVVTGDYHFSEKLLTRITQVTAADIQRVAQTYLSPDNAIEGRFIPSELTATPPQASGMQTSENFSPGIPVDPATVAQFLPPTTHEPPQSHLALPEKFTLKNGLRVLLLRDTSTPTITLSGHIQAGSVYDLQTRPGVASLTAGNLANGTKTKSALTLAQTLESRGAGLDLAAFREGVDVDGYALAPDLPLLLATLADILQNATFPDAEFNRSRQRAITDLQMDLDDPNRVARRVFQQRVYPANHPLHSFPTLEDLQAITREDLIRFYHQQYTPENTILTLVGNFEVDHVLDEMERLFGAWENHPQSLTLEVPPVHFPPQNSFQNPVLPGKSQAITYLGHQGIERRDARFYAALLLNHILGGDTLASRLGVEIRDRLGLTYGIYSYFAAGQYPGPFAIQMQTAPEDTAQAITATLTLLKQLQETGITEAELMAAKRTLMNSHPVDLANLDQLARSILAQEIIGLPITEIRDFPNHLAAVMMADVEAVLQELIHPDQMVIVSAGPGVTTPDI